MIPWIKLWISLSGLLWWTEKCLMFSGPRLPNALVTSRLNLTPDMCCVPSTWTCSWADRPWVSARCLPRDQPWHEGTESSCTWSLSLSLSLTFSPWHSMSLNVKVWWKLFTLMWIWNILQCNYRRQDVTSLYAQYQHWFVWRWFEVHRIMVAYWIFKDRVTVQECVHANSAIPGLLGIFFSLFKSRSESTDAVVYSTVIIATSEGDSGFIVILNPTENDQISN